MDWAVVVLLLACFAALGVVAGRRARPETAVSGLLVLAASIVAAGVLFIPVGCATGDMVAPFGETGPESPTGCHSVVGLGLPELGPFAGDTVGYGLAIGGFCLTLAVTLAVLRPGPPD